MALPFVFWRFGRGASEQGRWRASRITIQTIFLSLLLAHVGFAQSNVYSGRVIARTPFYERILLPKGNILRPASLRGIDDLKPSEHYVETNRIDRTFADLSRERTNAFYSSCLSEVPINDLSLRCPGGLLNAQEVRELLRDTVAIPRNVWTNHAPRYGAGLRYVFSLVGAKNQNYVVDERPGAFAVVYFPDGTYRCVVGPGFLFLPRLQPNRAENGIQPIDFRR